MIMADATFVLAEFASLTTLNSAQAAVNADCSGQGAGQNPNGPLPSGYSPAP